MKTSDPIPKSDSPAAAFHYCPPDGYFGDPVPFFWKGDYHLFYLIGQFDPWRRVRYTPYRHLVSTDLVHWKELPVAIDLGAREEIDMSLGTGTIIERNGTFYLFYCGRVFLPGDGEDAIHWENGSRETVCLATSKDLVTWAKDPGNPLIRPDAGRFQDSDFRDPFVFWNEEEGRYWMVISTKVANSPTYRAGGLALSTSEDLSRWEYLDTLWSPDAAKHALECPDIFHIEGRWYLFYSANGTTLYRTARSPRGPWVPAEPDVYDNGTFYAAKTMYDGDRRFLFGWIATREDGSDASSQRWGGHCAIPRELVPLPDGSLARRCPPEIVSLYSRDIPISFQPKTGRWIESEGKISGSRADGFAYAVAGKERNCLVTATVTLTGAGCSAGIMLRAGTDLSTFYSLRLEPARNRVVIERNPRIGEVKFLAERNLIVGEGERVDIKLFIDGDIVEAFVGERRALCCRIYDYGEGDTGLYVENGEAIFENLRIRKSRHTKPL